MVSQSAPSLRDRDWPVRYSTASSAGAAAGGLLHDFYIPALRRSVKYDRVAGYFRSSALAVASRGFSAMVGRERARIRMIVGADLEPTDVEAILAGQEGRLSEFMQGELDGSSVWNEGERRGVELLCWMVANGYLELKVAVRVHAETGAAIPFDDTSDGYMHEKWAVFEDGSSNRLYASGSVNESYTAWVVNAENLNISCDWWAGRDAQRVEEASEEFERVWRGETPHLRVYELPDAVQRDMVRIARSVDEPTEVDGSSAAPRTVDPPSALELVRFGIIRDGPLLPNGRYVGLATAPIEPWPHQEVVCRRLIDSWPSSHMLCDEVGLGKTIEAGLAFRSLHLAGIAKRILVAAPASLTGQWQREMASKFLMPFARVDTRGKDSLQYIFPVSESVNVQQPYSADLTIVSTGLLARDSRVRQLAATEDFEIVILDEAHAAGRQNSPGGPVDAARAAPTYTKLYRALRQTIRGKARSLWLATATPVQLHQIEAWDLLRLTRRAEAYLADPSLMLHYYELLGSLVRDEDLDRAEWDLLGQTIQRMRAYDPFQWTFIEDAVRDGRIRAAMDQWLDDGRIPPRPDRPHLRKLVFAGSPLSRVMQRHTRGLLKVYRERGQLGANLADREILPVPVIRLSTEEQTAYDALEEYCRGLTQQMAEHGEGKKRSLGFYLSFLRLRLASSLHAITETLRRRRERVLWTLNHLQDQPEGPPEEVLALEDYLRNTEDEDPEDIEDSVLKDRTPEDLRWERAEIDKMLSHLEPLTGPSTKTQELLRVLDTRRDAATGKIRQTVIFTRFYDTLTEIVRQIRNAEPGLALGTYSGKGGQLVDPSQRRLISSDRDRVKHLFLRGEVDVLVCTDAAAEGLNLQTADLIINFDLPWNPMKVEQRIGRIDRIGQRHETIYVLNLCYVDSAEQIVYDRLLKRLKDAAQMVGTLPFSLLPVELEEFEELAARRLDPRELERRALERMNLYQRQTASMEIPPQELYDIYQRLSADWEERPAPVDRDAILNALTESRYLRSLGCSVHSQSDDFHATTLIVKNVPDVVDGTTFTTSPSLFESGLPNGTGELHFASYGDPAFEALQAHLSSFELPASIRRIEAVDEEHRIQRVGYAVAVVGEDGEPSVELVTQWNDLENLQILEGGAVDEATVEDLRGELTASLEKEIGTIRAIERVERSNEAAAEAHRRLLVLLGLEVLDQGIGTGLGRQNFWEFIERVEGQFLSDGGARFPDVPTEALRAADPRHLLFDVELPRLNPTVHFEAPTALTKSVIDFLHREADAMKVRKSQLEVPQVYARLERKTL